MDITENKTSIDQSSCSAEQATVIAREKYSAPKMTEFGTIQKITASNNGSLGQSF